MGGGYFLHWRNKNLRFSQTLQVSNFIKIYENLQFLKILKEIVLFFKFYRNFLENLGKILRKFWKYAFVGGSSEASEIIENLVEKTMETSKHLKIFMNYESIFILKANFINSKGDFGGLLET